MYLRCTVPAFGVICDHWEENKSGLPLSNLGSSKHSKRDCPESMNSCKLLNHQPKAAVNHWICLSNYKCCYFQFKKCTWRVAFFLATDQVVQ